MRLLALSLIVLAATAVPASGQMSCCGASGNASQSGGLVGLKLVSLNGDTVRLAEHIGMMPMLMVLAGTDEASGKAVDVVQAVVAAQGDRQPMLVYVVAAGAKTTKAFAKAHDLAGLVLVDQKKTALTAAMADTMPVALFINRSGQVVRVDAKFTEATVNAGIGAMAKSETTLKDPVCGMTVDKKTAAASYEYHGKTYYFCSQSCRDNFAEDPQKYAAE